MEFNSFMGINPLFLEKKVLMLDDVGHVKHFRSVMTLNDMGFNINRSDDGRLFVVIMDSRTT